MTQSELKELKAIGAELGAAKAENDRLRGLLQQVVDCQAEHYGDGCGLHLSMITLAGRIKDALSQQAEPTDTFTAVDMATAAAQGFRDGQAAVEQATEQDERKTFEVEIPDISAIYDGRSFIPYRSLEAGERLMTVAQHLRIEKQLRAALTRPAQTEQEPIQVTAVAVMRDDGDGGLEPDWLLEGGTAEMMAGMVLVVAEGDITGDEGHGEVYAAPIAQTEQKPEQMNISPLLNAGAALSNIAFNLAQRQGVTLDQIVCDTLSSARKSWDAARADLSAKGAGKFRMGDLVKKSTGSEWEGRVVGWYSTEQTKEGYAVESDAHKGSVQIYPAKALEAVE